MKFLGWFSFFLVLGLCACGGANAPPAPASGNDGCGKFNEKEVRAKADRGDLVSIRRMRDYYFDCVIHNNGEQSLYWGRLAAEKGGDEDQRYYEGLKMTFVPK